MEAPTFATKPLLYCPSRDVVPYSIDYPTTWYFWSSTPEFRACSNCWRTRIAGTGLEGYFQSVVEESTTPARYCNYNTPRVRRLVDTYQAQRRSSRTLSELNDHIARRVLVKACKLDNLVVRDEDLDWHRLDQGLDACHACYEDFLAGAAFGDRVTAQTVKQPATGVARCDVGNAFCRRLASASGGGGHGYERFLDAMAHRGRLPRCEGRLAVLASTRNWYRPKASSLKNLLVCERCLVDAAGGTQYFNMFEKFDPATVKVDKFICGFGACSALRINFGLMMEWNDTSHLFVQAAETVLSCPPCTESGIKRAPWYTIKNAPGVAICAPCNECLVKPLRVLDSSILPEARPPPAGTRCALNPSNPRVVNFVKKLAEAAEKGEPEIFTGAVERIASTPPCPRSDPAQGIEWTGTGVFSACGDCAREVVFPSPMADFMHFRDATFPEPRKCDMYSDRVRVYWSLASNAPDPRSALDDFHDIMLHRDAIYRNVYPQMREGIQTMEKQALAHKRRQDQVAALQKLDASMAASDELVPDDELNKTYARYGNGQLRYRFVQDMGIMTAMDFNTALTKAGVDPALKAHLLTADKIWKEVE